MSWRSCGRSAAALVCALSIVPAHAAGGAHVVDDASVEDPGSCHVENWLSQFGHNAGLFTVAPACTSKAFPRLELGGFVVHDWSNAPNATLAGLTAKVNLLPVERGFGVGLSGSLGYSFDRSRIEAASLIVPLSLPVSEKINFNIDAGWQWARQGNTHDIFVGAQTEVQAARDIGLMAEIFTRTINKPGGQIGLRWTPHQGKVDVDLIGGRYVDGVTPSSVTIGLTIRI